MQRPILRLVAQGQAWVAVFFILLGYVNSLKCITQSRAGEVDAALSTLASSSFRRTGRLVFPAATVTVLAWFACQLGAFKLALACEAYWLRTTAPEQSLSWISAVVDLCRELLYTWFYFENKYDQPQWALQWLFEGSILVFAVLLATVRTTPKFRFLTLTVLYSFYWARGDFLLGTNIIVGIMLAELTMWQLPPLENPMVKCVPFLGAFLGLFLMSYPHDYHGFASWSETLFNLGLQIFPVAVHWDRSWPSIGAQILCLSICLSPQLRQALSHRYLLWLGSVSYSLYLLHGPLMRSVLTWMVYGPMTMQWTYMAGEDPGWGDHEYIPTPRALALVVILPIFWTFLLFVVQLWSLKVEPKFAVATKWMEDLALGNHSGINFSGVTLPLHRSQAG